MGSALWAGISGLNASSKELDVIANNLATSIPLVLNPQPPFLPTF